jgi:hypothetical protein
MRPYEKENVMNDETATEETSSTFQAYAVLVGAVAISVTGAYLLHRYAQKKMAEAAPSVDFDED